MYNEWPHFDDNSVSTGVSTEAVRPRKLRHSRHKLHWNRSTDSSATSDGKIATAMAAPLEWTTMMPNIKVWKSHSNLRNISQQCSLCYQLIVSQIKWWTHCKQHFQIHFLHCSYETLIQISRSTTGTHYGPIVNGSARIPTAARHYIGGRPLPEPMLTQFNGTYAGAQWVSETSQHLFRQRLGAE